MIRTVRVNRDFGLRFDTVRVNRDSGLLKTQDGGIETVYRDGYITRNRHTGL